MLGQNHEYMNIDLRIKAKNNFEKDFFIFMNNGVLGKTIENVRKHEDIKLVTTEKRRNSLASESNYYTTKPFTENLLAIKMKKPKILQIKPLQLGLSILELSKILVYEFWYDYLKQSYGENAKYGYMRYMDTVSVSVTDNVQRFDIHRSYLIDHYLKEKMKT